MTRRARRGLGGSESRARAARIAERDGSFGVYPNGRTRGAGRTTRERERETDDAR